MFYSATNRRGTASKLIYFGEIQYIFHKKDCGNNKNKAEERIKVCDHRNWLFSESYCFL
jgi:hypothetical protein